MGLATTRSEHDSRIPQDHCQGDGHGCRWGSRLQVAGCGLRVAGYELREAYATRPTLAGFPLRYCEETSTIILDSRTNGKS